jgi:hypothetical protein
MGSAWPNRSWLSPQDLAAIAKVHYRTILREISNGHLAASQAGGYVIDVREAKRWLAGFEKYAALRGPRKQGSQAAP